MARLDRLAPAREVAQIAACIGREFDEEIVGAVAGYPEPQLTSGARSVIPGGADPTTWDAAASCVQLQARARPRRGLRHLA